MVKLSIITVCRNQKDIQDTIDSVINQTFNNFEWIVVDGASNDGTLDKLKKVEDRINVLISEADTGIYNAMNKGIKAAKGEYLLFLNGGDNLCEPDILKKVFDLNLDADIIYGNAYMVNSDNSIHHLWSVNTVNNPECFIYGNISHQASFIKKELFEKHGLYNERYKICSDTEKFLIFYKEGAVFKKIDLVVSNHKNDGITSKDKKSTMQEKERMLGNFFSEKEIKNNIRKTATFFEKLFSVKNRGMLKCIFILGFLIELKRFK